MKKVILIVALLCSITAGKSQTSRPWEKLGVDSIKFVQSFGSVFQYSYQQDIENKSTHKTLCLWTGAKAIWLYQFALYLGYKDYNVTWDHTDENVTIKATPKIYTGSKPATIKLTGLLNKKGKIVSANISGPADHIIDIYVDYWELTPISLNELKSKRQIIKNFVSDKVSIKWTTANPLITVTKNTNAAMDVFPLK